MGKMKIFWKSWFGNLPIAFAFALPLLTVVSLPSFAIAVPQRVTNGLYRSSSEDFFQEGRRQFEREINILLKRPLAKEEPVLDVSEELGIQERLSPLEIQNLSPDSRNRSNHRKSPRMR